MRIPFQEDGVAKNKRQKTDGRRLRLHGNFTPAHADGCGARCFAGVQCASLITDAGRTGDYEIVPVEANADGIMATLDMDDLKDVPDGYYVNDTDKTFKFNAEGIEVNVEIADIADLTVTLSGLSGWDFVGSHVRELKANDTFEVVIKYNTTYTYGNGVFEGYVWSIEDASSNVGISIDGDPVLTYEEGIPVITFQIKVDSVSNLGNATSAAISFT